VATGESVGVASVESVSRMANARAERSRSGAWRLVEGDDLDPPDPPEDGDPDPPQPMLDGCPNDPAKRLPGVCGCGVPDDDFDNDGALDCIEDCPDSPAKTVPSGPCGCSSLMSATTRGT
jgi:hypothetical protein